MDMMTLLKVSADSVFLSIDGVQRGVLNRLSDRQRTRRQ